MKTILITEDDLSIVKVLVYALESSGFKIETTTKGKDAVDIVKKGNIDLLLLDLNLPDIDGIEVCRNIREFSELPIIMLTSRKEEVDKILGLEFGADDYVTKPFSPRELVARVKANLRRKTNIETTKEFLRYNKLVIDSNLRKVYWDQQEIHFTVSEYNILSHMVKRPDRIYTRDILIDIAYSENHYITDRTIDSHIKNIRKKLSNIDKNADIFETVYGIGYRIKDLNATDH